MGGNQQTATHVVVAQAGYLMRYRCEREDTGGRHALVTGITLKARPPYEVSMNRKMVGATGFEPVTSTV
jgi:hypothetical protein